MAAGGHMEDGPLVADASEARAQACKLVDSWPKGLVIDGEVVDAADGQTFNTLDPSTGEKLAAVALAGTEDIDRAVTAARRAFDDGRWSDLPAAERERVLFRLARLVEERIDECTMVDVLDLGFPKAVGDGLAGFGCALLHYYAGWPTKRNGILPQPDPHTHTYVRREPIGVCALIIPWNGPFLNTIVKVAPALAAGCTVVLKSSEHTPLSALRLGELCLEAGVPPGVVNIISGDGDVGAKLIEHPGVDKVSFTGSVETGRKVMTAAAQGLKSVTLELGGKSPNIVFPDAPIADAIAGSLTGVFMNSGQVCIAASRLFMHRDVQDEFLDGLEKAIPALKVGSGFEPGVTMGPLVSQGQQDRVRRYIDAGQEEGATLLAGGQREPGPGYFVDPTVFTGVRNDMRIAREEIFGPVLSVIPFTDLDEVIEMANDTTFGLAAGVWTQNLSRAHEVAARLRAGTVWVNCYAHANPNVPFGGYKHSGIGREFGETSLDAYTELKSVVVHI